MTRKEMFTVIMNSFEQGTLPTDAEVNGAIVDLCFNEIERLNKRKNTPRKVSEEEQKARDLIDALVDKAMGDGIARTASEIRAIVDPQGEKYSFSAVTAACKRLVKEEIFTVTEDTRNRRVVNVYRIDD